MSLAPVALSGKRIAFLDTARAVAALAVLFQHSLEGAGLVSLTKQGLGQTVLNFGEVGVLVFFLVSGFIIPASLEKIRNQAEFWRRRALRIYPLYFAVMVTNLILGWLVYHTQAQAAWKLLPHLVFIQTWINFPNYVGGSWTLFIELIWYVIFAMLFAMGINKRHPLALIVPLLLFVAIEGAALAVGVRVPFGKLGLLMCCFLGLLAFRYKSGEITQNLFLAIAVAYVAAIFVGLFIGFHVFPNESETAPNFPCVAMSWALGFAAFFALYSLEISHPWMSFVGVISYSIYLVHAPILHLFELTKLGSVVFLGAVWTTTLLVSAFTYKTIEKPFMDLGKGKRPMRGVRTSPADARSPTAETAG
ncbi:acyltransferase [Bradyrhizobium diazoefficiens]|nr:acyltransferase [Bradyrhizobium diazoefficiens]MBR0778160.1 acyltransferase [Bradyrhizobium diazoefficiens]